LEERLITWGGTALLLPLALWLAWPMLGRWRRRRRLERCIASAGVERMRNVLLDDGMGGMTFYEWILLTPREIRVFMTSGRSGIIFAGERMDSWAQVLGKRTIRFANPLYSLEGLLATLRFHLPKLAIEGNILFIGDCTFPKGRPDSVLTLRDLSEENADTNQQAVQPVLEQAWAKIKERARNVDPASEGYLLPLGEPPAYGRWLGIVLLVLAGSGWLYWRL
jgi:hypothetical protein